MIRTYGGFVNSWDIDEMGHLNVSHYLDRFAHANAHMTEALGHGIEAARQTGQIIRSRSDTVKFARELRNASSMEIHSGVTRIDNQTIQIFHRMSDVMTGEMNASCVSEITLEDMNSTQSQPLPAAIQDRAAKLVARPEPSDLPRELPGFSFDGDPGLEAANRLGMFETNKTIVEPMECDWTGRLRPRFIMGRYSDGASHMWRELELLKDIANTGIGSAVVQINLNYATPARAGDPTVVRSGAWAVGSKSLSFVNWLLNASTGAPIAIANTTAVMFDTKARKSVPVSDAMRAAVADKLLESQS